MFDPSKDILFLKDFFNKCIQKAIDLKQRRLYPISEKFFPDHHKSTDLQITIRLRKGRFLRGYFVCPENCSHWSSLEYSIISDMHPFEVTEEELDIFRFPHGTFHSILQRHLEMSPRDTLMLLLLIRTISILIVTMMTVLISLTVS